MSGTVHDGSTDGAAQLTPEEARTIARDWVYQRLALLSAVIWAGGAAILMATIVPIIRYPQAYIAMACTIPLLPAAVPWLFYSRLSDIRAARLLQLGGPRSS